MEALEVVYSIILILITFIYPLAGGVIAFIGLLAKRSYWRTNIFCVSLLFAVFAHCYIPTGVGYDLDRYCQYVLSLRGYSFMETMRATYAYSNLYTFQFWVWICNLFKDEFLLSAISVFIVYWCGLYCTCYLGTSLNAKWKSVQICLLIQLMSISWFALTNNVRNVSAFAIVGYAMFRDVYMNKKDLLTGICYIASLSLHSSAIVMLFPRIVLLFIKSPHTQMIVLPFILFSTLIVQLAHQYVPRITSNALILKAANKAYNYFTDTDSAYGLAIAHNPISLIVRILYLSITAIFCFIEIRRRYAKTDKLYHTTSPALDRFSYCTFIFCVFSLSCMTMLTPMYWRFSAGAILFSGAIMIPFLENSRPLNIVFSLDMNRFLKLLLLALVPVVFMRNIYQILVGLNWPSFLYRALTSSPLYLLSLPLRVFGGL